METIKHFAEQRTDADRAREHDVELKLAEAQRVALPAREVEQKMARLMEIQRTFHTGASTNNERYDHAQPIMASLLPHAARFATIGEYSLAFQKLVQSDWLSRKNADELLDHENAHALQVLQHPSGDVEYLILFMRNEAGVTDSFIPVAYSKYRPESDHEGRNLSRRIAAAPEHLSPSDLASLDGVE